MAADPQNPFDPAAHRGPSRKVQAIEVAVFLSLIVPSEILSFFVTQRTVPGFVLTAVSAILRDLSLISIIFYLVWRNGEPLSALGWRGTNWAWQIALGFLLFPLVFAGEAVLSLALLKLGFTLPSSPLRSALAAHTWTQVPLGFALVAVVAISEETIFRGYLLLRLENATGRMTAAICLSTLVFTFGHGYEGTAGMAGVTYLGLVFVAVYLSTGSLLAPIVLHFLQDILGVVVISMLTGHR